MNRDEVMTNLFLQRYDDMCKLVRGKAGGMYNAEDVVQQAFCDALTYWDTYNPSRAFLYEWFKSILYSSLNRFCREERDKGATPKRDWTKDKSLVPPSYYEPRKENGMVREIEKSCEPHEGPETILLRESDRSMIKDKIDTKPYPHDYLLELYYLKGYKPSDISFVVNLTDNAIRQCIHRFKEELKNDLSARCI